MNMPSVNGVSIFTKMMGAAITALTLGGIMGSIVVWAAKNWADDLYASRVEVQELQRLAQANADQNTQLARGINQLMVQLLAGEIAQLNSRIAELESMPTLTANQRREYNGLIERRREARERKSAAEGNLK